MLRAFRSVVLAVALTPALGAAARAEDGCGAEGRPTCTILRPPAVAPRERASVGWGQECIVVVGGLGSPTDNSDVGFFRDVLGDLLTSIHHRPIRFGVDAGSYDTIGAISRSAAELRRVIRRISDDCEATHLVAHSMGGVVVDRALSKLHPAAERVSTYVAMASPHNGATVARLVRRVISRDDPITEAVTGAADVLGMVDPRADAIRDLAEMRAPRQVPRVEHVRLRLTTDLFVHEGDHADRRVDVRQLTPESRDELEGHEGIVRNGHVQALVRETIRRGRVPPAHGSDAW